jgi:4-hydroxybenzoate polyprenyltransferase
MEGRGPLLSVLRAIRPHQWVKNLLVFVPLVTSHQVADPARIRATLLAFAAFALCASALYVVNDLFDIRFDRKHPRKRLRPLASGDLGTPAGIVLAGVLGAGALVVALFIRGPFLAVLAVYTAVAAGYTVWLKRQPVVDLLVLASLYVLRVVGGGVASAIEISDWLLGFALFLFLSLAFVKRYSELIGQDGRIPGRGYGPEDGPWMLSIGTSAGYMAILILALYVTSTDVSALYAEPRVLWLLCPLLLFWITRVWLRAIRRQLHDDPVVDALRDRASYVCAVLAGVVLVAATVGVQP